MEGDSTLFRGVTVIKLLPNAVLCDSHLRKDPRVQRRPTSPGLRDRSGHVSPRRDRDLDS